MTQSKTVEVFSTALDSIECSRFWSLNKQTFKDNFKGESCAALALNRVAIAYESSTHNARTAKFGMRIIKAK
jgi:hypothetical protein